MGHKGNEIQHSYPCQCYIGDTNVKGPKSEEQMVVTADGYDRDSLGIKKKNSNRPDVYQQN